MIISQDLFRQVLVEPFRTADELRIVSGYATSMMARRHIETCQNLRISLIVGMGITDGISMSNHRGFVGLEGQMDGSFTCRYNTGVPTHSKLYVWYSAGQPVMAYIGSANYTQRAFIQHVQNEILCCCDPREADTYYQSIIHSSVSCTEPDIENRIPLLNRLILRRTPIVRPQGTQAPMPCEMTHEVELPLVDRRGNVPARSGLNWGQRNNRNHNEAYLSIPASIARSGFFPPRTIHFNVLTDDGVTMVFSVAQDTNKALHTPEDNSIMGHYFRRRLGLQDGEFVTRTHLEAYGRTTVTMLKDDEENYYLDFSV